MFVKLNETLINLDLVKEISEVIAYITRDDDGFGYHYDVSDPVEITRWIERTTDKSKYKVMFGFKIFYLQEQHPKHVKVSIHRNEAVKAREALATLLNGNTPVIHEIKF